MRWRRITLKGGKEQEEEQEEEQEQEQEQEKEEEQEEEQEEEEDHSYIGSDALAPRDSWAWH